MATQRAMLAFTKALENNGNVSKAMREAGYPPTTAKNPQQLTRTKGWKELCKKAGLTETKLLKKIVQGLEAKKVISANITYGDADEKTNDFIEVDDFPTQHKYVETGLKVIGRLKPEEDPAKPSIAINFIWRSRE